MKTVFKSDRVSYYAFALFALDEEDPWSALEYIELGIEEHPNNVFYHLLRADIKASLYLIDYEAAEVLEEYARTIELDPEHGATWYSRARFNMHLMEWEKARADLDRAIEIVPNPEWIELRKNIEEENLDEYLDSLEEQYDLSRT